LATKKYKRKIPRTWGNEKEVGVFFEQTERREVAKTYPADWEQKFPHFPANDFKRIKSQRSLGGRTVAQKQRTDEEQEQENFIGQETGKKLLKHFDNWGTRTKIRNGKRKRQRKNKKVKLSPVTTTTPKTTTTTTTTTVPTTTTTTRGNYYSTSSYSNFFKPVAPNQHYSKPNYEIKIPKQSTYNPYYIPPKPTAAATTTLPPQIPVFQNIGHYSSAAYKPTYPKLKHNPMLPLPLDGYVAPDLYGKDIPSGYQQQKYGYSSPVQQQIVEDPFYQDYNPYAPVRSKKEIKNYDPYSQFYDSQGQGSNPTSHSIYPEKSLPEEEILPGPGQKKEPVSTGFMRISMNEQKLKFLASLENTQNESTEIGETVYKKKPPKGNSSVVQPKIPKWAYNQSGFSQEKAPNWAKSKLSQAQKDPVGTKGFQVNVFDSRNSGNNYRHQFPSAAISPSGPVIKFKGSRAKKQRPGLFKRPEKVIRNYFN